MDQKSKERLRGYLLVRHPQFALRNYEGCPFAVENKSELEKLRAAFGCIDASAYRGFDRQQLMPFPSLNEAIIQSFRDNGIDMDSDSAARRFYHDKLAEEQAHGEIDGDGDEFSTLADAREVWSRLCEPDTYEIILISVTGEASGELLGYDVGWFSNYSIINDTFVRPIWHPPDPDDYAEMNGFAQGMNQHVLFPTRAAAEQFLAWYRTRPWGEDFGHESVLTVIQVESFQPS